jgi:Flp pilus assembly CpaF family ATPase/MinD-like ATPase involved in chromosome partitioning or flagellar assembly
MAKIVSIVSSKGGVGSTFFAVNLGICLTKNNKAILIDFYPNSGSVMLSLSEDGFFENLVKTPTLINLIPSHKSGLSYLNVPFEKFTSIGEILNLLQNNYEYIIFDVGENIEEFIKLFDISNLIVMVVNPDLISIKSVQNKLREFSKFHYNIDNIKFVLNKYDERFGVDINSVKKYLNKEINWIIPYNLDVLSSINKGEPICFSDFGSNVSRAIRKIADEVEKVEKVGEVKEEWKVKKVEEEEVKKNVHKRLVEELKNINIDIDSIIDRSKSSNLTDKVKETIEKIFANEVKEIKNRYERDRLIKEILQEALGLGPLEDLINDPEITEIMVNSKDKVYIEKKGKLYLTDKKFISDKQILTVIERIVAPIGRRIDESVPLVDARLPDGSRVNAIIPPLALKGPSLTIRKFSKERLKIEDLIKFGSLTKEAAEFLKACVIIRKNIVISGGTGSGKTTLLNIVSEFIPSDERIITIEDSAELNLPQEHVVTLESRPPNIEGKGAITIRDLVKNALRMRPDRIIVGECRSGEALDMLQAMNTGHDGSLTTLHSNSPRDTLSRLETMVLMAGMELPLRAIREQISSAVDLIVHQSRFKDGSRKITHITEVVGMEGDIITTQDIFLFKQKGMDSSGKILGTLEPTGVIPSFIEDLNLKGIKFDMKMFS